MIKLNPYLTLPGTGNDAIAFYTKVFGVKPKATMKFKDMPPSADGSEGMKVSAAAGERILHAAFEIGNDMLMLSDAREGQEVDMGAQVNVSIHPDNKEEADRIFSALSEDGEVIMPLAMQFWGDYYGMCRDKFGVPWMVNFHDEKK